MSGPVITTDDARFRVSDLDVIDAKVAMKRWLSQQPDEANALLTSEFSAIEAPSVETGWSPRMMAVLKSDPFDRQPAIERVTALWAHVRGNPLTRPLRAGDAIFWASAFPGALAWHLIESGIGLDQAINVRSRLTRAVNMDAPLLPASYERALSGDVPLEWLSRLDAARLDGCDDRIIINRKVTAS